MDTVNEEAVAVLYVMEERETQKVLRGILVEWWGCAWVPMADWGNRRNRAEEKGYQFFILLAAAALFPPIY